MVRFLIRYNSRMDNDLQILYANTYEATPITITQNISGCEKYAVFCPLRNLLTAWKTLYYSEEEQRLKCEASWFSQNSFLHICK